MVFVVDDDEGGEIFDLNFLYGFYVEFGEFEDVDFFDVVLSENCGGVVDGVEVKIVVGFIGVGDGGGMIVFGEYDYGIVGGLELIDVRVYVIGGGGIEGIVRYVFGRFRGIGVIYRVIFYVLG